jgi:hypothetical protein
MTLLREAEPNDTRIYEGCLSLTRFDGSFTSTEVVYGVTGTDVTQLPECGVSP